MAKYTDDNDKKAKHTELLEEALERFQLVAEAESEIRSNCLDDLKFSIGEQWPMNIRSQRELDGRPCLTMDQIQQSIRQVCNEYRQQRPAVQVNPVGNDSDVDTAEILQGIVRHIEVNSDAEIAYDGAHEAVVRTGFQGSWRILTDYANDETDDQEVIIEPIKNNFSVYWQPGVPNGKAKWAFIIADIPWEQYKDENPDSRAATLADFTSTGNSVPGWASKEYIRVAEYFCIEEQKAEGKKRPKKQICWYKLNAIEILDEREIPGSSIPIISAYGDDLEVDGKRYVAGLVRNAKDPQRMYNYWNSAATEAIALAPKAPFMVAEGQLQGHEKEWEQANTRNLISLTYKQTDVGGKPAPVPQRNQVEPPIQAMTAMIAQASLDLKASTGLYNPSLGQREGDSSGKAIEKLQQQGDVATLNYSDNMARAMRRHGRLLLEWIREKYDVPRVQRIINPDGTIRQVVIHNGKEQAQAAQQLLTDQIRKIYDIGVGQYDVTISVGPSYQTKRQEAVSTQLNLLKTIPQELAPIGLDLIVRNMDIPQAKELADRFKKMLPPQLQDGDEGDPAVQLQKANAQLQQMGQQHQLLVQHLQEATQIINTKQVEQQGKLETVKLQEASAQTIEKMKLDAQITMAEINTKAQEASERMKWEREMWLELHGSAHEIGLQKDQQQHQQELAQQQQAAQAQGQQADQQHEVGMAAMNQQGEQNGE